MNNVIVHIPTMAVKAYAGSLGLDGSQGAAWIIERILAGDRAGNPIPADSPAIKTGTSYGYRDAWVLITIT